MSGFKLASTQQGGLKQNSSSNLFEDLEEGEGSIIAEINVTPLVDIFMLLLVIFMVTSEALFRSQVDVELPRSDKTPSSQQASSSMPLGVILTLKSSGRLLLNGTPLENSAQLKERLPELFSKTQEKLVVLESDKEAPLQKIIDLMDAAKQGGAQKFSFSVTSQETR